MTDVVIKKMELIFKKEDMDRISTTKNGEIMVDLHGMGTKDAMTLLNNVIAMNRDMCNIRVIHGYNHGICIKDMINSRYRNPRITGRTVPKRNPGMTIISCTAAC